MPTDIKIIHLLRAQSPEVNARILESGVIKHFKTNEAISWQADACEFVYFILKGEVEIYRLSPAGREQILDRLGQSGCFNLVPAFLENASNQANARALSNCELLTLCTAEFNRILKDYPDFALAVMRFMSLTKSPAMAAGMVSRAMTMIKPTTRMVMTTVTAIRLTSIK